MPFECFFDGNGMFWRIFHYSIILTAIYSLLKVQKALAVWAYLTIEVVDFNICLYNHTLR